MKTFIPTVVLVVSAAALPASAQIRIRIPVPQVRIAVPVPVVAVPVIPVPVIPVPEIRFEAPPPMVEIEPGVQVVSGYGEEVFFSEGFYWHRRDGHWFRSHDHLGHWAAVEEGHVPGHLAGYPVGRYRNFQRTEARREAFAPHAAPAQRSAPAQHVAPTPQQHVAPAQHPVVAARPAVAPASHAQPQAAHRGGHR